MNEDFLRLTKLAKRVEVNDEIVCFVVFISNVTAFQNVIDARFKDIKSDFDFLKHGNYYHIRIRTGLIAS